MLVQSGIIVLDNPRTPQGIIQDPIPGEKWKKKQITSEHQWDRGKEERTKRKKWRKDMNTGD